MSDRKTNISIQHILGNIFSYYGKNIVSLVFLFLIVAGPFYLVGTILSCHLRVPYLNYKLDHPENSWVSLGYSLASILPLFIQFFGSDLYLGTLVLRQEAFNNGRKHSPVSYIFAAYRRIGSIFILSFLVNLIVLGGFLLLIVPGIFFWLRYCVSMPVLISENTNFAQAMRRSRAMVYGNRLRVFLLMAIVHLISLALFYLTNLIGKTVFASSGYAFEMYILITLCFLSPFLSLTIIFLYRELNIIEQNKRPTTDAELIQEAENNSLIR